MIVICTNQVAGHTGYHKSVVQLANGLHDAGYPVAVLSFLSAGNVADRMLPLWPFGVEIPVYSLRTLPAAGGRLLHRGTNAEITGKLGGMRYAFTANELAALRELNAALSKEDTIIFTGPMQPMIFQEALGDDERRPRTILQIHGDYLHHSELWEPLMSVRPMVDTLQTVADGLRDQFIPAFDADDVVFIPNFPGESEGIVARAEHEGVNIALPASYQRRKNQLDAVRALSLIEDESVYLTLWGARKPRDPYFIAVKELVSSLGLTDRVHMPGFGTEFDVYSTADIVIMTSLSEGFGYPLIEAMYQGRPSVSYDFDFGPRESIVDGETGFIVPVGDVEQLAERLQELSSDENMRERFGKRARERYDERFSPAAVTEHFRNLLGPHTASLDLAEVFSTDGVEPIAPHEISHRVRGSGERQIHRVTVNSRVTLHDVRVDGLSGTTMSRVRAGRRATQIEFDAGEPVIISYTTIPGSSDRYYLASINPGQKLEVLAHLRRDAQYGSGRPAALDTIHAASGGSRPFQGVSALTPLAKRAPRDVLWKIRQIAASSRSRRSADRAPVPVSPQSQSTSSDRRSEGADSPSEVVDPSGAQPAAMVQSSAPMGTAAPAVDDVEAAAVDGAFAPFRDGAGATSNVSPLAGLGARVGKMAVQAIGGMESKASAPSRREIPRHPWFPVTAGVDSFGTPINQPGGVQVQNSKSTQRPTVTIRGEYDWVLLRDGKQQRRVHPPFSYGEFFERICAAEREHGLFDITTRGGVHVWELGRSALIIQLAEALGYWGAASAAGGAVRDEYHGTKLLSTAPSAKKVVFDYVRRGQSGYRTAPFVNDETLFVVQPDAGGYPGVDDSSMVYPFAEFTEWKKDWRRRWAHLRVPDVDARPFEEALSDALGIQVDLGGHLRSRLLKFLDEREFFTPVFEAVGPEEVLISSSHWWAGIGAAAARSGAQVSDIQYALTSRYAPSFWFGGKPHYGATRFYAWSDFWAERTNVYDEHVVVPRDQPELTAAIEIPYDGGPVWDVCVISQHRVLRRILAFVQELVRERPGLRVVIAPHPSQRASIGDELSAAGLRDQVSVAAKDTLSTIRESALCVGTFSTSLWEAAALGRPTYVIEVPGYEETLQDIESGLFRLAQSPHDLVPFDVPSSRADIFPGG
ncbi:glycosyltransferase [Brachybacterium paraconglomeratum]|uniref:glycosyltransferase n=1 Tax=Brachybacterium paraconglomeratum TaxID=173362 RepID=UPI00387A1CB0